MSNKIRILLIEDNPSDARLIDIYLKESFQDSYSLVNVVKLSEGIKRLDKEPFDVVILDLSLPDNSGINTFKNLFSKHPNTPIVVLTGVNDEDLGITAVKLGAQEFLFKNGLDSKTLKHSINYSIERHLLFNKLKEYNKKLEVSEKRLNDAQKIAHLGSWDWNLATNQVVWSEEMYRIHGLSQENFIPDYESIRKVIHPEDVEYVERCVKNGLESHHSFSVYYRIVQPDRSIRFVHGKGDIVTDEQGNQGRILGTVQDITEIKKEEELEMLSHVASKSYNSVIIADNKGKIEWVNEGFMKLFSYSIEDVKGTSGEILKKGGKTGLSEDSEIYKAILKNKQPVTYESKNYTKSGEECWLITTTTPILDAKGEIVRLISIDSNITKQKKAEEELKNAYQIAERSLLKGHKALDQLMKTKRELEQALKVKDQFLANMSHEIRTPMNAIVGFTDLLLKSELKAEQKQFVSAIKTSGENLLIIINDILDFSKLESGKVVFEKIKFKLSQVLSNLVELMLPKSTEKNIQLSSVIDHKISEYLAGDPTRLSQILTNLVGNAIKFTARGVVKIAVNLVEEKEDSVVLEFSVTDTGIGIPEDKLSSVFENFNQASNDTTRKYGGTGLGLTITKQLIEAQGGSISVTSEVNKGSRFSFKLEFTKADSPGSDAEAVSLPENMAELSDQLENARVLLVDDNSLNQVLAKKVLTGWKLNVEVADNGLMAAEMVQKNDYDVILMDIQMPEMDGYEATRYIRKMMKPPKSDVPIIAMTAHAMSGEADKCRQAGMNDYISKPFNQKTLHSKIISALGENKKNNMATDVNETHSADKNDPSNGKYTDLAYLKQFAAGSNKFMTEMIEMFVKQTPAAIESMQQHLNNENWASLRAAAHKIKPSISFMGIHELKEVINSIEISAENQTDLGKLPELLSKMKTVCDKAIVELEAELKRFS